MRSIALPRSPHRARRCDAQNRKAARVFIATLAAVVAAASPAFADDHSVSLFDGKTLKGWEGNEKIFRVENGAIVAGSLKERIKHNDFLCTTREFGDFELQLKCKLIGMGHNAGIQFRSARVANDFEVAGYQCDVGSEGGKLIWGALYDESRRRRFLAEVDQDAIRQALKPNDWNSIVIRCEGDRIRTWINGTPAVDYREADQNISKRGVIGLQIHSGMPAEAWYKDIRIQEL